MPTKPGRQLAKEQNVAMLRRHTGRRAHRGRVEAYFVYVLVGVGGTR